MSSHDMMIMLFAYSYFVRLSTNHRIKNTTTPT